MEREVFITEDGSSSIRVPGLGENYHSALGALTESAHVFIKNGLERIQLKQIRIFDIGFGTGLNAYLSYLHAIENNLRIEYFTVEKYPLTPEEVGKMNFSHQTGHHEEAFHSLHASSWGHPVKLQEQFTLMKIRGDLLQIEFPDQLDLIFFDAFAPDKQPDLWEKAIFQKLFLHLNAGGIFVTYSAKGQVRRDLIATGFEVERLPGPPGKREMIRAIKQT